MYRKRLKNVYDLLENGNNKRVIQEVDKLISSSVQSSGNKKSKQAENGVPGYDEHTTLVIAKALKSLALVRTGKKSDADKIIDELLDSNTTDENALSIIMQYCRETQQLSKIVSFYENAANNCSKSLHGTPEHEEMLSSLFYAYVRNRDFAKQQQVALKLYKQTNRMMFCYWQAASYVMLSKSSSVAPQQQAMYSLLAEKILEKAYLEKKMEYNGEFLLYLNILEEKKKYEEAFKIVDSFDEQTNLSKIGQIDFKIRKKFIYLKEMKKWNELKDLCAEYLSRDNNSNLDDWLTYLTYLDTLIVIIKENVENQEPIEDAMNFLNGLRSRIDSSKKNDDQLGKAMAQGPFLARIELINRILTLHNEGAQENSHKFKLNNLTNYTDNLKEFFRDYVQMFSCKPGFYFDILYFKDLIKQQGLEEFILSILKEIHDKNRPFKNIKSIYSCLSYWQMHRFFGKQLKMNQDELTKLAGEFESMYLEALNFGKELLDTGFQYADEFIILAVHIRYDLYKNFNSNQNNILQLIVNLKQALVNSPSNYQLKLLLLNLYSHLGAYDSIQKMYESMEIKNIQNYSTANLLLVHNIRLGALSSSLSTYSNMDQFFTSNLFDMANFLVNCYKYGTFLKAIEICSFMDTIRKSLTLNLCLTNYMSIAFIMHSTQNQNSSDTDAEIDQIADFKQLKLKMDQYFKEISNVSCVFESANTNEIGGLLPDDKAKLNDLLVDHNEKDVLYHWDTAEEQQEAKKQYDLVLNEQRQLLKLRNLVVRFIEVCFKYSSGAEEGENKSEDNLNTDQKLALYKKKINEFDYNVGYSDVPNSSNQDDDKQESDFESKLKIYITKSFYLKRWSQLNLNSLFSLFINFASDILSGNEKFFQDEASNNQANLSRYRDTLKESFESLKKKFDLLLTNVLVDENNSNFKIEHVGKILESYSSLLEVISYIVIIFTSCLSSQFVKPMWSEKSKKSKKKKAQYAQYAPSIDIIYEIYETLCLMTGYFSVQLKQNASANILSFTDAKFQNIRPTNTSEQSGQTNYANFLNDISQSYSKSLDELKNFFNAKLKFLVKFSGQNPPKTIIQSVENLKLN